MAGDPKNPVVGEFVFDGSEFEPYAVDLPPGGCQGLLTDREGSNGASDEIVINQDKFGAVAGIPDHDAITLAELNARIGRINVFLPALSKALEMLIETSAVLQDARQRIIFNAAQAVDRRAKKNPELLAKYQKTRAYRSAVAMKAVKTRMKNGEESGAEEPEPAPDAPQAPPAVP